jgi:prepilin-type N-terminal cleavage/methylation domain-containing protein
MKNKAFTILELLVVIVLLGIFALVAYPNVTKWITDREVKKEVYDFVGEINEMKAKVTSGEYALAMVRFTDYNNGPVSTAFMKKYYMTTEDYIQNYSGSKANWQHCDYDIRNQRYHSADNHISELVRHWPNIHMCISKNGSKKGVLNQKNPDTGQSRSLSRVIFCSTSNTTTSGGSNRCNDNNKNDYRYMVTWDVFTNLTIYKFNYKKNQWCTKNKCRSYREFN